MTRAAAYVFWTCMALIVAWAFLYYWIFSLAKYGFGGQWAVPTLAISAALVGWPLHGLAASFLWMMFVKRKRKHSQEAAQ